MDITLREVKPDDLPEFFAHQQDREACWMAAFTAPDPTDRNAFDEHWQRIISSDDIQIRTVLVGNEVAGHVSSYIDDGRPEVTYWIGRDYWGRGVATTTLRLFLTEMHTRPVFARAAADNSASIRVLEKNGFRQVGNATGYANARGQDIEEVILCLDKT